MATSPLNDHLRELLDEASRELPGVTWKRMFGCDAAFVNGSIYALVWKDGRIGLKFPTREKFDALMSVKGSDPWTPGGMNPMSKWILVPEAFHDDHDALSTWVHQAHADVAAEEKKPAKKKTPAKKKAPAAKKKPAATKSAARKR